MFERQETTFERLRDVLNREPPCCATARREGPQRSIRMAGLPSSSLNNTWVRAIEGWQSVKPIEASRIKSSLPIGPCAPSGSGTSTHKSTKISMPYGQNIGKLPSGDNIFHRKTVGNKLKLFAIRSFARSAVQCVADLIAHQRSKLVLGGILCRSQQRPERAKALGNFPLLQEVYCQPASTCTIRLVILSGQPAIRAFSIRCAAPLNTVPKA